MATTTLEGFVHDENGSPVSSATVEFWTAVDTTPGGAASYSTTTDADGHWTESVDDSVHYDVKISKGTKVRWIKGNSNLPHSFGSYSLADDAVITRTILAGAVTEAKIAANAVTQRSVAHAGSNDPTTVLADGINDLDDMSIAITTTGGDLLCHFASTFINSSGAAQNNIFWRVDADQRLMHVFGSSNTWIPVAGTNLYTGVAAGAHTVKIRWETTAGTLTSVQDTRMLTVVELKK